MGRLNGLAGGFVLTSSVIYLTVFQHHKNSLTASRALRDSSNILDSMLQPLPSPKPRTSYYVTRTSTTETMKDLWNDEVEMAAKWAHSVDTGRIAVQIEEAAAQAFGKLKELTKS